MHEPRIDAFDLKLLTALQENGALTNQELADRVGLSASQCSRRRAALEQNGVIERYRAMLSTDKLGLDITAFIEISLAQHSPENARAFAERLETLDSVLEAYSLTGDADYLIKVSAADLKALSRLLNEEFLAHPGVARLRSSVVLDRLKQTTALPLRAAPAVERSWSE